LAPVEKIKLKTQKESAKEIEEVSNLAYEVWKAQEQQELSYLLTTVSRDVLVQVAALPMAAKVCKHIETSFALHSCARVIITRMALATTQKASSTIADYISKMKSLADDMAAARKKLDVEELSSYVLACHDYEYNSLVSSIVTWVEPITFAELYSQLLSLEMRLDVQGQGFGGQSSVDNASRGHGGFSKGRGGCSPDRGTNTGGRG
jgi:hypothetical protein